MRAVEKTMGSACLNTLAEKSFNRGVGTDTGF
jgi:hypothetical protein